MKVNIDAVKTTAFVLKNRCLGYKLLQNPKGTNPNEVTMIKRWFGINSDFCDKIYSTIQIRRKKEGDKFITEKTEVVAKYLMDPDNFTYSGKNKNITVYYNKDDESKFKQRDSMPYELYKKRPLPDWLDSEEKYEFERNLFEYNNPKNSGYYLPRPGLLARIVTLGAWREILGYDTNPHPVEPGFWHVLKTNLNGGGIRTKENEPHSALGQFLKNLVHGNEIEQSDK